MKIKTMECGNCQGTGLVPDVTAGLQLRAGREKRKMSLDKLSAATGLSKTYLADLEKGRRSLNNTVVNKILAALGEVAK